ncbi:hypothetical protein U2G54_000474 [Vibrio fluvialis]|nr:hypothetical protein [Vibrio fluvialis]
MSMSMSLTLEEKQLLRALADLAIHNPLTASSLFTTNDFSSASIFPKISNIVEFVSDNRELFVNDESRFYSLLDTTINQIKDNEVRTIFRNSYEHANLHVNEVGERHVM